MQIRSVGVGSVAKVAGALYAGLGLIIGACIALFSIVGLGFAASQQNGDMPAWLGPLFGVGAIVLAPLFYGLMGLIMGAITAALYNVVARMVGGVQIDVE